MKRWIVTNEEGRVIMVSEAPITLHGHKRRVPTVKIEPITDGAGNPILDEMEQPTMRTVHDEVIVIDPPRHLQHEVDLTDNEHEKMTHGWVSKYRNGVLSLEKGGMIEATEKITRQQQAKQAMASAKSLPELIEQLKTILE